MPVELASLDASSVEALLHATGHLLQRVVEEVLPQLRHVEVVDFVQRLDLLDYHGSRLHLSITLREVAVILASVVEDEVIDELILQVVLAVPDRPGEL